jgi:hypothetical protein
MTDRTNKPKKSPSVFWLTYHAPLWETKAPSIFREADCSRSLHQVRDALAFCELLPILIKNFLWGGVLLNLPAKAFPRGPKPEATPKFSDRDLITCVTRPPLSDRGGRRTSHIDRSYTKLERLVMSSIHTYFLECCSRTEIKLAPALEEACRNTDAAKRAHAKFRPKKSACYERGWAAENLGRGGEERTPGYVLYVPQVWHGAKRFALLIAFGISGVETLFLSMCLAGRFQRTLRKMVRSGKMHFLMLEWPKLRMKPRPISLAFLRKLDRTVEVLVHLTAEMSGSPDWKPAEASDGKAV